MFSYKHFGGTFVSCKTHPQKRKKRKEKTRHRESSQGVNSTALDSAVHDCPFKRMTCDHILLDSGDKLVGAIMGGETPMLLRNESSLHPLEIERQSEIADGISRKEWQERNRESWRERENGELEGGSL